MELKKVIKKLSIKSLFQNISVKNCLIILLGCLIQTIGMYNIHSISGITEGGVLGLLLLFDYWFNISPAVTSIIFNGILYFIGYKTLGKDFIVYSVLSIVGFSIFYSILEHFPRIYPEIVNYPLLASILGGIFIGVGAGLTVRYGAASSGDDALAMTISKKFKVKLQIVYLISDLVVLALSLTYIPFKRIIYSLLTVVISGQLIGLVAGKEDKKSNEDELKESDDASKNNSLPAENSDLTSNLTQESEEDMSEIKQQEVKQNLVENEYGNETKIEEILTTNIENNEEILTTDTENNQENSYSETKIEN